MQDTMTALSGILLALSILALAYTTYLSCAPPNASHTASAPADVIETRFKITTLMRLYQIWVLCIGTYHALLCLFLPFTLRPGSHPLPSAANSLTSSVSPYSSIFFLDESQKTIRSSPLPLCPHADFLNPTLFAWSPYLISCVTIGIASGLARLQAYRTLGKNFSLKLQEPEHLVRVGLYAFMRHPSYTFWIVNWFASVALLGRADGVTVRSFRRPHKPPFVSDF